MDVEVPDGETASVDLFYPLDHRPDGTSASAVRISLCHVRAAGSITVRYSFPRDGWVIYMDETRPSEDGGEVTRPQVEVAFVPAWLETPQEAAH
jgi:hypothetical protein